MLESPALLLCPRRASEMQPIIDARSRLPLGFARWGPSRSWWQIRSGPVVAVYEQEDAPLLFTVHRCWSLLPWFEVRDADDHPVGLLLRGRVHDPYGSLIACIRPEGRRSSFRGSDERNLGWMEVEAEGLVVTFGPEIEGCPFTKMLLLAAALERK